MHRIAPFARCISLLFRSLLGAMVLLIWLSGKQALANARKPSVLIVYAALPAETNDVRAKLLSSGQFSAVALFDGAAAVPPVPTLKMYDAVLLMCSSGFNNAAALGNNLADYVDAGGGVVNTTFSVGVLTPPAGRWNPGYLCMAAGGGITLTPATLDLASISFPNHPILIGVGSFTGGTSSYRINQNVAPGASIIARWTGGNVLCAVGPLPGRADLNFYLPSKDVDSRFWDPATDGQKLMVNALLYVMRPRVLIAGAPSTASWNDDVKAKIAATGTLGMIDIFNTSAATPTLAELKAYDAVLVYSDANYQNRVALGNNLADYVDAGGGVVECAFTTINNTSLSGRWQDGYRLMDGNGGQAGSAALGALAYPLHPALGGVFAFNGGSSSYRSAGPTLRSGAFVIASWSDGNPLVVGSTKFPNRVDLDFFPPSKTVRDDFWSTSTYGGYLMADALLYTVKPYVLVAAADPQLDDIASKLFASRRFSSVDAISITSGPPTLVALRPYGAVATWSKSSYPDPSGLGDVLADYVDAGGGEITAIFGNVSGSFPQDRWVTQGYEITPSPLPPATSGAQQFLGDVLEPGHPIAAFVRKFDGSPTSFRQSTTPLLRGRTIMNWTDGKMLASVHNFRKRADLGFWPVSNAVGSGWNQRTDGTWLMANALEFVVRRKPCPGDFNGDGVVDDADFVHFIDPYNNLVDPRGDLSGDGFTEDSDFVIFSAAYNELVCP